MKKLQTILEWALLLFTALLGLKFTHSAGTPEIPAFYGSDAASIFYGTASSFLFVFLSALLLLFSLILNRKLNIPSLLWLAAVLCSLPGIVNASTPEVVRQTLPYLAGLGCFATAVNLQLEKDSALGKKLIIAILTGGALALLHGWYQMLSGMNELEEFVAEQGLAQQLDETMLRQIASDRLYGPFQLCNTFGGYLAALLPLALTAAVLWAKNKVQPPRPAMLILGGLILLLFAVPLWRTGSRGAVLTLFAGVFAVLFVLFHTRKARLILAGCGVIAAAAGICMVIFVRGAESMIFRFDYALAACKMMFAHPFTGTGWGDFFTDYPGLKLLSNDETPHSPHNLVLFFGSQCGLAGFLAALALLAVPLSAGFRKVLRMRKESGLTDETLLAAGLLGSLTVISLNSLIEVGIEVPAYAALLILLSALLCCRNGQTTTPKRQLLTVLPVGIFALLTLICSLCEMKREAAFADLYIKSSPVYTRNLNAGAIRKAYLAAPQDSPYVHRTMANYLAGTGQPAAAKVCLDKALELAPEQIGTRRFRAQLCAVLGLDTKDDVAYILRHDPQNPENRNLPGCAIEK